jgi:hypothetical protein
MLFALTPSNGRLVVSKSGFSTQSPSSLNLREKDIEAWLADDLTLLFPNEELLLLARSVAGKAMADILALDTWGRLVIIEIKRDWCDRTTVGQILEYAATLKGVDFEQLQTLARNHRGDQSYDLENEFLKFADLETIDKRSLAKSHRLYIVAPDADESLSTIVDWLREYSVPLQFVPFSVYGTDSGEAKYLRLDGVVTSHESKVEESSWAGHWIFNTNETHEPGAYNHMFAKNVAAIYGYPNGPYNLEGASVGDRILAYVNRQGLRAVGRVVDPEVKPGSGAFPQKDGTQVPNEFHLRVAWEAIVPESKALSSSQAKALGYDLPVRSVFARLHRGSTAANIEKELRRRASA